MCTRYSFNRAEADLGFLGLGSVTFDHPSQQISPGRQIWIVRNDDHGNPELVQAKWGLVPPWLTDFSKAQINARVETACNLPMFKDAWAGKRCLILADSYFQWYSGTGNHRQLWKIAKEQSPLLLMGGLWERYRVDSSLSFDSCAILTVPANEQLSVISDRMPAQLDSGEAAKWLKGEAFDLNRFSSSLKKTVFSCQSLIRR